LRSQVWDETKDKGRKTRAKAGGLLSHPGRGCNKYVIYDAHERVEFEEEASLSG
jgi:hypothetical protein